MSVDARLPPLVKTFAPISATPLRPIVNCTLIYSALDMSTATRGELAWRPLTPLSVYLEGLDESLDWAVSLNGEVIERETWSLVLPQREDYIVVMVAPQGANGKGIFRMLAMLAVAALAPYAAGLLGPLVGISSALGTQILGAGIAFVGTMLVNALFPVPPPATAPTEEDSPSYGIDGPKNTAQEDIPLPIVYGEYRCGGNIQVQTFNQGDTQILLMLSNVSEGTIESITEFRINDQPAENFEEVQTDVRLGTPDQEPMSWFSRAIVPFNQTNTLSQEWILYETVGEIDQFRLDYVFPLGLFRVNEGESDRKSENVWVEWQYKKASSDVWIEGASVNMRDNERHPVRRSIESPILEEGLYHIRTRRTNREANSEEKNDKVQLADVNEIVLDKVAYRHTAQFGIRVKLTDQLEGLPTVTAKVRGRKVDHYDKRGNFIENKWSNNPAWITLDLLTHARYGGGEPLSRFILADFYRWAKWCELKGLTFNGIFDTESNVWDAAQKVLAVGHAQISPVGTRYGIVVDMPTEPSMMFGMSNIIKGTFSIEWMPLDQRANEIEVKYFDRDDYNKEKSVREVDDDAVRRGDLQRIVSLSGFGVDNRAQASYEAKFQLAKNKALKQTVSFDATLEAIGCTIGDVVLVQHDMPQWGYNGRLERDCTTTVLKLGQEVPFQPAAAHVVLVHYPAQKVGSVTIQSVSGSSVFVTGVSPDMTMRSLKSNVDDRDQIIAGAYEAGPYTELVLSQASLYQVGDDVAVWDGDVMVTRGVEYVEGTSDTLTLTSPLPEAPGRWINWMFGPTAKVKKPFRLIGIQGEGEYKRTLKMLEYSELIYGDMSGPITIPNYSTLDASIAHVRNIAATEDLFLVNADVQSRVTLTWQKPAQGLYMGADIYIAESGGEMVFRGRAVGGANSFLYEVGDPVELTVRIVAFDALGKRATGTAPELVYTVSAELDAPANVTNFKVRKITGGIELSWDNVSPINLAGYEIREGLTWDAGTVLVSGHQSNRFQTTKSEAGTYRYHIRARSQRQVYSPAPTSVTLDLPAPAAVDGFISILNNGVIVFNWRSNTEPDIDLYEVREGASWAASTLSFRSQTNYHTLPANTVGERTFWIKAVDRSKVYSTEAAFTIPLIERLDDRNVLVEQLESPGFAGAAPNMEDHGDGYRVLAEGALYGEYVYEVDLGATLLGRHVVEATFDVVIADLPTWADANFTWNSPEADHAFVGGGDLATGSMLVEIATELLEAPAAIDEWAFRSSTTGVNGTAAAVATGVTYDEGRFGLGVDLVDGTSLEYALAIDDVFSLTFWLKHHSAAEASVVLTLNGPGAVLSLTFDPSLGGYRLTGTDGVTIELGGLDPADNGHVLVGIVQTGTQRKLMAGMLGGLALEAVAAAAPIGAIDNLSLA